MSVVTTRACLIYADAVASVLLGSMIRDSIKNEVRRQVREAGRG